MVTPENEYGQRAGLDLHRPSREEQDMREWQAAQVAQMFRVPSVDQMLNKERTNENQ